jgi:hypothetical protein
MTMHLLQYVCINFKNGVITKKIRTVVSKRDMITSKTSPVSNFNNLSQQLKLKHKYCNELDFWTDYTSTFR